MPWSVRKRIRDARPWVIQVFPIVFYLVVGFGIFNIVLGLTMLYKGVGQLSLITIYTPSWLWALIFMFTGIFLLLFLIINSWKAIRFMLLVGILLKTIWSYAFIFSPDGLSIILPIWLFVAYIQITTYILFSPSRSNGNVK